MSHWSLGLAGAMFLGVVQGITEFLPVSSDGHLAIGSFLLGIPDMPLAFVVFLHAGTLLATLLIFRSDVARLVLSLGKLFSAPKEYADTDEGKLLLGMVAATIPTGIIGIVLEHRVESSSHVPWIVGVGFFGSALAVTATRWGRGSDTIPSLRSALMIGTLQGLAVLPGLSRSASTIAGGMLLGLSGPASFRFSFLLSLPAVAGAILLELRKPELFHELGLPAVVGAVVSFFVGYAALRVLQVIVARGRFWAFAFYLIPLGLALIVWDVLR